MTSKLKKIRDKKLAQEDLTAEEQILDDIFYDLYRNRGRVYKVNFFRGIFFGLGTFLGGTVVYPDMDIQSSSAQRHHHRLAS